MFIGRFKKHSLICTKPKVRVKPEPKVRVKPEPKVCDVCLRVFKRKAYFDRHICVKKEEKVHYNCGNCGRNFIVEANLNKHLEKGTCCLSKEEIKQIRITKRLKTISEKSADDKLKTKEKRRMTMESKSEEEREDMRARQAASLKKTLNELTNEELVSRNENTRIAMLKFYASDAYDVAIRSEGIKRGLAKNKVD